MKPFRNSFMPILALFIIFIAIRFCHKPLVDPPVDPKRSSHMTEWPDSIYDVVADAYYLSEIDKDVIIELNKCRTNPSRYADEVLVPFLDKMSSDGVYFDSDGLNIKTNESKKAIDEAINDLKSQKPLHMLKPKDYLCSAAKDHCADQGPHSRVGHGGSDGSSPIIRVRRYNPKCYSVGENIAYGSPTGLEIIRNLIVDDGVPDRGHRKNIFFNYNYVGTAFGPHQGYRFMCVMDFE